MDFFFQLLLLVSCTVGCSIAWLKTKRLLNPISIVSGCFFLFCFFSLLRLSGLQGRVWETDTYIIIFNSLVCWVMLPSLFFLNRLNCNSKKRINCENQNINLKRWKWLARFTFFSICLIFICSNYIQSGLIIPTLAPEIANEIHHKFPPIIGVFARMFPLVGALLYVSFYYYRSKLDLLLILLCFIIPLSRLTRMDFFIQLVVFMVLHENLPIIRIGLKKKAIILSIFVLLTIGVSELGTMRLNRFGKYSLSYSNIIQWQGPEKIPEAVPIIYAYFALAFENLNNFIIQVNDRTYGAASLEWLWVGFLKLHFLFGFDEMIHIRSLYEPISSGATVPTALASFYLDYGSFLSFFPLLLYMALLIFLFEKSKYKLIYLIAFSIYAASFSLANFQAIIVHPNTFWSFFCLIIFVRLCTYKKSTIL